MMTISGTAHASAKIIFYFNNMELPFVKKGSRVGIVSVLTLTWVLNITA